MADTVVSTPPPDGAADLADRADLADLGRAVDADALDADLAGLDALELADRPKLEFAARAWSATWPKLAAVGLALLIWQLVVWSGWKPDYVLPGPGPVFKELVRGLQDGSIFEAVGTTMQRAFTGYALAVVIGVVVGALVSRIRVLRIAVGSMITGLQTMPSIAWFPLAVLLFKGGEGAIFFVVVIGAAPAIANGLISGTDHVAPVLIRAGRVLGARRLSLYRHVILPAALPGFVGGLKQGWAFAWRSLLAGELIVLTGRAALGVQLTQARELADTPWLLAVMVVILVIGILIDAVCFGTVERSIRRRRGLLDQSP
jgi:NitT/TauT family transport system permease protein